MKKDNCSSFQTSDGTSVPYKMQGKGDPIIFVHGLFGKSDDFSETIENVSKNYYCISYDQRGHGKSEAKFGFCLKRLAQDLKELIEHLVLDHVILVGYSLGAFTIFNYIQEFGCEHLKKIILVDITPKMVNDHFWKYGLYQGEYKNEELQVDLKNINNDYMTFASYFTYRNMTKYTGKTLRHNPPISSKILARLLIKNTAENRNMTFDLWKDVSSQDHRETLKIFAVPTAIFFAEPGSLFAPQTAAFMQDKIPNHAKLVPFINAGHALVFSHGKQFAEEVKAFAE